ncbi:antibiotic biosynthesis monooxygenase family protein [Shimia sp. MIT1388]|uniref:antibiotic biosynthesis monooxygenase family protein n=1 Tax=Shimia sp. MIT1388 TaxID=3096992 RepID=UPI00399AC8AD
MGPFFVIAEVAAPLTNESQVEKALIGLAEQTHGETGCIEYRMCRELSEEVRWVIYEVWKTEQDWRSHLKVDHLLEFKDLLCAIGGTLTARKFVPLGCT